MKVFRHLVGINSRKINQILDLLFTTRDVACDTITLQLATDSLWLGSLNNTNNIKQIQTKENLSKVFKLGWPLCFQLQCKSLVFRYYIHPLSLLTDQCTLSTPHIAHAGPWLARLSR